MHNDYIESEEVWDTKVQQFHGGQDWKYLENFVEDFSVTTNALGTPKDALEAAKEAVSFNQFICYLISRVMRKLLNHVNSCRYILVIIIHQAIKNLPRLLWPNFSGLMIIHHIKTDYSLVMVQVN